MSKKSKSEDTYPGRLGKPTVIPNRQVLLPKPEDFETVRRNQLRWERENEESLTKALMKHFGIEPDAADAHRQLALALSRKHVPAFRYSLGPGPGARLSSFHLHQCIGFVGRVSEEMASGAKSKIAVLEGLNNHDYLGEEVDLESLRQRYYSARRTVKNALPSEYADWESVEAYCREYLRSARDPT